MTITVTPGFLDLCQRVNTWRWDVFEASIAPKELGCRRRRSSKKRSLEYQCHRVYDSRRPARPSIRPSSICSYPSAAWNDEAESFDPRTASCDRECSHLDDLPDGQKNPLITDHPSLIEEEYCRVLTLYNRYKAEKVIAQEWWFLTSHPDAMQALFDAGIAVQLTLRSSLYIEEYSRECGMNIDFRALFLRHCYIPHNGLNFNGVGPRVDDWKFLPSEPAHKPSPQLIPGAGPSSLDFGVCGFNFVEYGQPSEWGCVHVVDPHSDLALRTPPACSVIGAKCPASNPKCL